MDALSTAALGLLCVASFFFLLYSVVHRATLNAIRVAAAELDHRRDVETPTETPNGAAPEGHSTGEDRPDPR